MAGLVAITPCAGFVGPMASVVIGALAGVVCFAALQIKFMFNFDDALDVIAVHLVGGVLGSLLVGLFGALIAWRSWQGAMTVKDSGETSMIIADLTTGSAGLQSDRIRTLAVTSKERSKKYPDVPTLDEAGVKGYEVNTWIGFFAPAGTPAPVLEKLRASLAATAAEPEVQKALAASGNALDYRDGAAFQAFFAEDTARLLAAVARIGKVE